MCVCVYVVCLHDLVHIDPYVSNDFFFVWVHHSISPFRLITKYNDPPGDYVASMIKYRIRLNKICHGNRIVQKETIKLNSYQFDHIRIDGAKREECDMERKRGERKEGREGKHKCNDVFDWCTGIRWFSRFVSFLSGSLFNMSNTDVEFSFPPRFVALSLGENDGVFE